MEILFTLLAGLIGLYLLVGMVMATSEKIQTDDKFDWKTIFTWLYKAFK